MRGSDWITGIEKGDSAKTKFTSFMSIFSYLGYYRKKYTFYNIVPGIKMQGKVVSIIFAQSIRTIECGSSSNTEILKSPPFCVHKVYPYLFL